MRSFQKMVEEGTTTRRAVHQVDLSSVDLCELHQVFMKAIRAGDMDAAFFEPVIMAYSAGVAAGMRHERYTAKKRARRA